MPDYSWSSIERGAKKPLLMLGNPVRGGLVAASRVDTAPKVKSELGRIVDDGIARLRSASAIPYSETQNLDDDQYFSGTLSAILGLNESESGDGGASTEPDVGLAASLITVISEARATDKRLSPAEVQAGSFVFYIVVVQDADGNDVAFVRKTRGLKVATGSKFFMIGSDKLSKLEEPIFRIDYYFDFVIQGDNIAIWNVDNFLKMFGDMDALTNAVPAYVESIEQSLDFGLSSPVKESVLSLGRGSPRMAQQIRRISRLAYLSDIEPEALNAYLDEISAMNHSITLSDGNLEMSEADVPAFLNLLEQRLWKGPFDGAIRQAQAFSQVSQ
ncbi:Kiwa anti-phage protein KwaB-like domain-containing protein [Clavibacter nebraskensis]|uniref:DUF4868 domain-containing protein n=1 Tax=Clavibacter nebraskensis TaxID=31963 RepID=A0A399Q1I1_9MICO|nr:Kiwa anti-phage protein KwaB-like domain-containing protein [Clavibacter nebraskensis]RIJ12743.1 DUF4868 domain-containing protein [Clavibacter nebraskensis]UKF29214.1 DUF4868 domain-containing protein [Clavibacter nebraskensis]